MSIASCPSWGAGHTSWPSAGGGEDARPMRRPGEGREWRQSLGDGSRVCTDYRLDRGAIPHEAAVQADERSAIRRLTVTENPGSMIVPSPPTSAASPRNSTSRTRYAALPAVWPNTAKTRICACARVTVSPSCSDWAASMPVGLAGISRASNPRAAAFPQSNPLPARAHHPCLREGRDRGDVIGMTVGEQYRAHRIGIQPSARQFLQDGPA